MNTSKERKLVIGDVHGAYKALVQVLDRCNYSPVTDQIIFLGDYIDGGRHIEIEKTINLIDSIPNKKTIIGNHDLYFIQNLKDGWHDINMEWFNQGGINTLNSLGIKYYMKNSKFYFQSPCPEYIKRFLNNLDYYYLDNDNNVFVHAGWTPMESAISLSMEVKSNHLSNLTWERDFWMFQDAQSMNPHKEVFIGHTFQSGNPQKKGNIWNLDSGAGHDGLLTIMDVESKQYWQSDLIRDLYTESFSLR